MQTGNGTATLTEEANDYNGEHNEQSKASKPFFRRLSFKGLRKGKVN